jgi:hypothetical protein
MTPTKDSEGLAGKPGFENEGEGNRTAARRYDQAQQEYVRSGHAERAAEQAEEAIDSAEGDELRAAEDFGKSQHAEQADLRDDLEEVAGIGDRTTEPDINHGDH